MKLKGRVIWVALGPMLVTAIVTMLVASVLIERCTMTQAYNALESAAYVFRETISVTIDGKYHLDEEGKLLKGEQDNAAQMMQIVDYVKEKSGLDVTIFWYDQAVATSVKGSDGQRFTGSQADARTFASVLEKGQNYKDDSVMINGERYITYYMPLSEDDPSMGMLFFGKPYSTVQKKFRDAQTVMFFMNLILCVCSVISSFLCGCSLSKVIQKASSYINEMSKGKLGRKMENSMLNRKDEIGQICRDIDFLDQYLYGMVQELRNQSVILLQASDTCNSAVSEVLNSTEQIDATVQEMASATTEQAENAVNTEKNVQEMGKTIDNTESHMKKMSQKSTEVIDASKDAEEILSELNVQMDEVNKGMEYIKNQINETHQSVEKIGSMTEAITNIAGQTDLLSLNASIEAARAGEMGKGFSVVAMEIRKLAEQCNESAVEIKDLVLQLMNNSNVSVKAMMYMQQNIQKQSTKLAETTAAFEKVKSGINESNAEITRIEHEIDVLDQTREEAVNGVRTVSDLVQQNAAGTEETAASIDEVARMVTNLSERMHDVKNASDVLEKQISIFRMEDQGA